MIDNNAKKIIKYFILLIFFSILSVKMKEIILNKIAQNGFQEISNKIFSFYEVHNSGAAFNIFTDKSNELILAAVVCLIIITAIILVKTSKLNQTMISSMALLSSGMLCNTIERINNGFVTDYVYFTFFKNFPVFNLSDIMIFVGAILIAFSLLLKPQADND